MLKRIRKVTCYRNITKALHDCAVIPNTNSFEPAPHIDLRAEMNCLCAVSSDPGGGRLGSSKGLNPKPIRIRSSTNELLCWVWAYSKLTSGLTCVWRSRPTMPEEVTEVCMVPKDFGRRPSVKSPQTGRSKRGILSSLHGHDPHGRVAWQSISDGGSSSRSSAVPRLHGLSRRAQQPGMLVTGYLSGRSAGSEATRPWARAACCTGQAKCEATQEMQP